MLKSERAGVLSNWLLPPVIRGFSLWRISSWEEGWQGHLVKGGRKNEEQVELVRTFLIGDFKNKTLQIYKWSLLLEGQLCSYFWGGLFLKLEPCLVRGRRKWEEKKGLRFRGKSAGLEFRVRCLLGAHDPEPEAQFPLLENRAIRAFCSCCRCWR